jgi:uncharacterized protein YebE (UPF0316 family)
MEQLLKLLDNTPNCILYIIGILFVAINGIKLTGRMKIGLMYLNVVDEFIVNLRYDTLCSFGLNRAKILRQISLIYKR